MTGHENRNAARNRLGQGLKAAFVFVSMPVGGAEDFALTVARHLPPEIGAEFVCLRSLGVIGEELRTGGKTIELVPVATSKRWNIPGIWKLARWLKMRGISVVHSQTYNAHTYAIPAARLAGCASVLHQQKTLEKLRIHRRWMMRWLCGMATRIVTLSEKTRDDMMDAFGIAPGRMSVVPNVVDRGDFAPVADKRGLRKSLGLDPDVFLIGGIASLNEVKNHEATLDVLAELRKSGVDFHALLVGEGQMRAQLAQKRDELRLCDRLELVGNKRPVTPWLQSLDLLVLPSHWEGQPMILLQAMACGVPVVASRIEGNVATLGAAHPALFEPARPGDYFQLARRVIGEAAFRAQIRAHQQTTLATLPDAPDVAAQLAGLYLQLGKSHAL